MENKNVFESTVSMLIEDANSLQTKFRRMQENNDFRGALDCMRLLKDCLSLIKEYDWKLHCSEYKTGDGENQIAVWEQNHCGEIKNHKTWVVKDKKCENKWIELFSKHIEAGKSCLVAYSESNRESNRATGKSYALTTLCNKYRGIIVHKNLNKPLGITNNCKQFSLSIPIIKYYKGMSLTQHKDRILFIDEMSGLTNDEIDDLTHNHIVIGFEN